MRKDVFEKTCKDANQNNVRVFQVGITGMYMVGHSTFDVICRSQDLINWESVESSERCILAEGMDIQNYRFNTEFVEAVSAFHVPLEVVLEINESFYNLQEMDMLDITRLDLAIKKGSKIKLAIKCSEDCNDHNIKSQLLKIQEMF